MYSDFDRTFCKQTVETLSKRCVLGGYIVYICFTKRIVGIYVLSYLVKQAVSKASVQTLPVSMHYLLVYIIQLLTIEALDMK